MPEYTDYYEQNCNNPPRNPPLRQSEHKPHRTRLEPHNKWPIRYKYIPRQSARASVAGAARRFDIDSATAGIWAGEDADSIAFTIQLMPKSAGQGFKANGHTVNDQYEIDFTIGETDCARTVPQIKHRQSPSMA
jgi:hypothetical protein